MSDGIYIDKEQKKKDYSLPKNTNMEDMCYCFALCATSCARKKCPMEVMYTASDFSGICTKYSPSNCWRG